MQRVLILYAAAHGKGHRSAAEALSAAFRMQDRRLIVRTEDALDYGAAFYKKLYAAFYRELSENLPALWERVYQAADGNDSSFLNQLRMLLDRIAITELDDLVRDFRPDAVVCTHFLPLNVLSWYRQNGKLDVPLFAVVTDYTAHLYWVSEEAHRYFVASKTAEDMLAARGVPRARIDHTGIPVDPSLPQPNRAEEIRRRHHLKHSPVVTFVCSALGAGRVRSVIRGILESSVSGTLIVVPGRDPEAEEAAKEVEGSEELELRVLSGFIDYLDELIAASDLIISKPGGLVVSEVLAQGVPLLLVEPLGGQEEWNADYVVSTGAGVQTRLVEMVPKVLRRILEDPSRLELMKGRAGEAGRPTAAEEIVRSILTAGGQDAPSPK